MLDPWSLRHHRLRKQLYMTWRLRAMIEGAAAIHFTTGPECERCAGLRLPTPIIIEPIGVNFGRTEVCPTPGAFRGNQPRLGERPYVLFLGRVCAKKGLDLLVPAFARCTRGPAMLVIAGPDSGGYRAHVERAVRRFGLEDNVLFTGMLSGQQRLAALAEAALFVLPSRQENFALAVAEAMGAGLPVIVSDQVNICADVDRAGAGAVVQLDVGAWAAELSRWLADGPLRTRAGARAAAFAREYYDIERIAAGWADHYDHLVKVSRPGWRGVSGDVRLR
jgi:glycosyltransferase involved in cell wall biosynthesis